MNHHIPPAPGSGTPRRVRRLSAPLAMLAAALLATGCGRDEKAPAESASQVAAKIDGTEISVHQINYVLTRAKLAPETPEAAKAVRRQVLEKLIDQQLLVQKAVEDKLDRSPDVQMALENARRDVLAEAYLQRISGSGTRPSDQEILKYFSDHPELFTQRRVFQLQEINFPKTAPADAQSAVRSAVESGKPADEVTRMLGARGVEFAKADTQRPSEQISLDLLPRLYALRVGQGMVAGNEQAVSVIYLKSFEEAPLAQAAALPRIAQFLTNRTLSQNVGDLVKALRTKAKIDYQGEFADGDAAAASPK